MVMCVKRFLPVRSLCLSLPSKPAPTSESSTNIELIHQHRNTSLHLILPESLIYTSKDTTLQAEHHLTDTHHTRKAVHNLQDGQNYGETSSLQNRALPERGHFYPFQNLEAAFHLNSTLRRTPGNHMGMPPDTTAFHRHPKTPSPKKGTIQQARL